MSSWDGARYRVVEDWEKLPEGYRHLDGVGVATDAQDRVYFITRSDSRVIVFEPDGTFVTSWGEGVFTPRTHCIRFGPDGSIYTADDGDHTVRKFTPDGKQLMMIGTPGAAIGHGARSQPGRDLRQDAVDQAGRSALQQADRSGDSGERRHVRNGRVRKREGAPFLPEVAS